MVDSENTTDVCPTMVDPVGLCAWSGVERNASLLERSKPVVGYDTELSWLLSVSEVLSFPATYQLKHRESRL